MKNKNKFIKFFQKRNRARRKKKFWQFFGILSKKIKKFKRKRKIAKFFTWFQKRKKKKVEEKRLIKLIIVFFILIILALLQQIIRFSNDLIQLESREEQQKIQVELKVLKKQVAVIETDFKNSQELLQWGKIENRQLLAEKIRHLNYLNSHLSKTIEAYNQDDSLQLFRKKLGNLEKVFQESQNVELISERIANKIDILLLFDQVDKNQKELLEKDFSLFYEKIDLINSF